MIQSIFGQHRHHASVSHIARTYSIMHITAQIYIFNSNFTLFLLNIVEILFKNAVIRLRTLYYGYFSVIL